MKSVPGASEISEKSQALSDCMKLKGSTIKEAISRIKRWFTGWEKILAISLSDRSWCLDSTKTPKITPQLQINKSMKGQMNSFQKKKL